MRAPVHVTLHRGRVVPPAVLLLTALAACGGDGGTDPDSRVAATLRVTLPEAPRIGDTVRAMVVALNAAGREVPAPADAAPPAVTFRGAAVRTLAPGVALAIDSGTVTAEATRGSLRGEGRTSVVTPTDLALALAAPDSIRVGDTTAVVRADATRDGAALPATAVRFRVLDSTVARLDARPDGRLVLRPAAVGTTTLEARVGARTERRTLRVLDAALITFTLRVNPEVIDIDDLASIDITALDALGNFVPSDGMAITLTGTEATLVGPVTARGVRPGRVVVQASARGRTASDTLSIVPRSALTIDVRPAREVGGGTAVISDRVRAAVDLAIKRWRQAIVGQLPSQRLVLAEGTCANPALDETIEGMRVYVSERDIPVPGVIAQAAACVLRPDGRTLVGLIEFDSDELTRLNEPLLANVALHEFGHVLGFGSSWRRTFLQFISQQGTQVLWTGPAARAAFEALPNRFTWSAGVVPLTADRGHYDDRAMRGELMEPFFRGGVAPLSRVTVGVLADMGYVVNPWSWNRYALPLSALSRPGHAPGLDLRHDVPDRPVLVAQPDGRVVPLR